MSEKGQIVVTNFDRFRKKYNREAYISLQKAIDGFVNQRQNKTGADHIDIVNIGEARENDRWESVKGFLLERYSVDKYDSALIIGNDDVIPFCCLPNKIDDELIYSDSYYFDLQERADHFPELSVGRLPDTLDHDGGSYLLGFLRRVEEDKERVDSYNQGGITSEVWYNTSRMVLEQVGLPDNNLLSSPPFGTVASKAVRFPLTKNHLKEKSILFFNLHGEKVPPYWFGERRSNVVGGWLPVSEISIALTPEFVGNCSLINSLVVSTACHTTAIKDKTINNNLALALLNRGCIAVIGPSATAYSYKVRRGTPQSLTGINLICYMFLKNAIDGFTLGESLRLAKIYYASQGIYDDVNILTCNLLGDPKITLQRKVER